MNTKKLIPYLLAIVQFSLIGIILFTGPVVAETPILLFIEILAIALGVLSVLNMGIWNFKITPNIKQNGKMVSFGIYRIIRHPMYLSIILFITPLLINHFNWFRLAISLALFIDLILKLDYEERLLKKHFKGYEEYRKRSFRLIPFVY
jgi:protein-S-isoprenylcysteine O-methyltransferase Ste14